MQACEIPLQVLSPTSLQSLDKLIKQAQERTARAMDGTNHSRGSTIQSLSPDKREGLEHELQPDAYDDLQPPDADRRGRRRALGWGIAVRGGIVKSMFYSHVPRVDGVLQPGPWSVEPVFIRACH